MPEDTHSQFQLSCMSIILTCVSACIHWSASHCEDRVVIDEFNKFKHMCHHARLYTLMLISVGDSKACVEHGVDNGPGHDTGHR